MNTNANTIAETYTAEEIAVSRFAAKRMLDLFRNDEDTMIEILSAFIRRESVLRSLEQ